MSGLEGPPLLLPFPFLLELLSLNALLVGSMGQGTRCPGRLTALTQDSQEVLYAGRGEGEVEPEGAASQ